MVDRRSLARVFVLMGAIGGHVLLIVFLANTLRRNHEPVVTMPQDRIQVFFLELPYSGPRLPGRAKETVFHRSPAPPLPSTPPRMQGNAITLTPEQPVDWYLEAEEVARATDLRALSRA